MPLAAFRSRSIVTIVARLHADQRGVTSVMSLVAVLVFTMLLVMLTNVMRHLDDKVRMQNAADAAAFSGAVVLSHGMNSIALANHLESETFALVALLRALDQRGSTSARQLLPVMEYVLGTSDLVAAAAGDHLLSNFQRDVVQTIPQLAQEAANEIALRHGLLQGRPPAGSGPVRAQPGSLSGQRGPQWGVLWRTSAVAVGHEDQSNPLLRSLPVIDPNQEGTDFAVLEDAVAWRTQASVKRLEVAGESLRLWVDEIARSKNRRDAALLGDAMLQLLHLHEVEYPSTNLPFLLRSPVLPGGAAANRELQQDYSFVGVAYRWFDQEHGPKLFSNPLAIQSDAIAFAQASLFLPKPRYRCCPWVIETDRGPITNRDGWPTDWDSFNQTWSARLVPADAEAALAVLQTAPPAPANGMRPLSLGGVQAIDIERVNTH
jgi:hypothetical protein